MNFLPLATERLYESVWAFVMLFVVVVFVVVIMYVTIVPFGRVYVRVSVVTSFWTSEVFEVVLLGEEVPFVEK